MGSMVIRNIVEDALALERRAPLATADGRMAALAQKLNVQTQLIEPSS